MSFNNDVIFVLDYFQFLSLSYNYLYQIDLSNILYLKSDETLLNVQQSFLPTHSFALLYASNLSDVFYCQPTSDLIQPSPTTERNVNDSRTISHLVSQRICNVEKRISLTCFYGNVKNDIFYLMRRHKLGLVPSILFFG